MSAISIDGQGGEKKTENENQEPSKAVDSIENTNPTEKAGNEVQSKELAAMEGKLLQLKTEWNEATEKAKLTEEELKNTTERLKEVETELKTTRE